MKLYKQFHYQFLKDLPRRYNIICSASRLGNVESSATVAATRINYLWLLFSFKFMLAFKASRYTEFLLKVFYNSTSYVHLIFRSTSSDQIGLKFNMNR